MQELKLHGLAEALCSFFTLKILTTELLVNMCKDEAGLLAIMQICMSYTVTNAASSCQQEKV